MALERVRTPATSPGIRIAGPPTSLPRPSHSASPPLPSRPIPRRDEALAAIQDAMRQQQEQELAIDTELQGFKKDIVKQQVGGARMLVAVYTWNNRHG